MRSLRRTVAVALAAGLLLLVGVWVIAYRSMARLIDTATTVEQTHHVLRLLEATYSRIGDAETGSRSYVLTGDERYLEPANSARRGIAATLVELQTLAEESPGQRERLARLAPLLARRLAVLDHTVALRREQGFEAALACLRATVPGSR